MTLQTQTHGCRRVVGSAILLTTVLLTLTVVAGIVTGQVPDSESTHLEKVFTDAIEAVGNQQAIASIQTITAMADCEGPKGTYKTEVISNRKSNTRFTQSFSYRDERTQIYINGVHAWDASQSDQEPDLVSPFQKLVVHLHEYQKLVFCFEQFFENFQLVGTESFQERPCTKIRATHELGGEIFLFFDQQTKRLTGYTLPIPNTDQSVTNSFDEWVQVGNLRLPSVITAVDPQGTWTLRFNDIQLKEIDEDMFSVPRQIKDRVELLRLQKQAETAHLTYDAELFLKPFADPITQIKNGEVKSQTKAENLKRIQQYFDAFEFEKWENISDPVIRISKDGTLATITVQKRVSGREKNKPDAELQTTEFAWLEVWEKQNGKWKLILNSSTRKSDTN